MESTEKQQSTTTPSAEDVLRNSIEHPEDESIEYGELFDSIPSDQWMVKEFAGDGEDYHKISAMEFAIKCKNSEAIAALIVKNALNGGEQLCQLIQFGLIVPRPYVIEKLGPCGLIEAIVDTCKKSASTWKCPNSDVWTQILHMLPEDVVQYHPEHYSLAAGLCDLVRLLNTQYDDYITAWIDLFIGRGACCYKRCNDTTALHLAATAKIAQYLWDSTPMPSVWAFATCTDANGKTPFYTALKATPFQAELVFWWLRRGSTVDQHLRPNAHRLMPLVKVHQEYIIDDPDAFLQLRPLAEPYEKYVDNLRPNANGALWPGSDQQYEEFELFSKSQSPRKLNHTRSIPVEAPEAESNEEGDKEPPLTKTKH
jgi:hypothetical protein